MFDLSATPNKLLGLAQGHAITIMIALILASFLLSFVGAWMKKNLWYKELRREQMLSPSEQKFSRLLKEALPDKIIFAQVSFNALVTTRRRAIRPKFNTNFADFVICNAKDFSVEVIVELDGPEHETERGRLKDEKRDKILKSVGYRVERFLLRDKPTEVDIISRLR